MNFKKLETTQKLRGGYCTDADIAAFLAAWALEKRPRAILEPSCGDGAFIEAIARLEHGAVTSVAACEIDAEEAARANKKTKLLRRVASTVHVGDFLEWSLPRFGKALAVPTDTVGSLNTCYHLITRARVRIAIADYRAGIEDCEAAIDLKEPSLRHRAMLYSAMAHLSLGEVEAGVRRAREAIESVNSLFAHIKRHRDARYFLAFALLCAGQSRDSLQAYREALSMCSASGVVSEALLDLRCLQRLAHPPAGTADAIALLEAGDSNDPL